MHNMTPTKLSPREQQIASLIASGYTDMQIAAQLRISFYTVRAIVRNIHLKMGTNRRVSLAVGYSQSCSLSP